MADYRKEGNIAILEVNYPPVNALGYKVRSGITDGLKKANEDAGVGAIVLCGKGQTFPAGADISEFSTGGQKRDPDLVKVCNTLEASGKPVVAAIHGTALGGGCEIAISCHYRVALNTARFGFPEVDLGILPGATGTQRFPRLAGLKFALDVIPSGRQFSLKEASKIGMIDKAVTKNHVQEAVAFARQIVGKPFEDRRTSTRKVQGSEQASMLRSAAMQKISNKQKGQLAPVLALQSVMNSLDLPFEEGLKKERELSMVLGTSGQSRAMQYAFFAQRAAVKWSLPNGASYKNTKPGPLKTGAVIGAGTMGTGIAMAMLNAGFSLVLLEQDKKFLEKGIQTLKGLYEGSVRLGRMSKEQAEKILQNLKPSLSYDDIREADIVVEAVFENMELKKKIFAKMDAVCKPGAILASNTSALNIDEIASATKRPEDVIGTHFFVPAYYMRLLENVRGTKTSPQTIATAQEYGRKIGKVPILVADSENYRGFVGNRMLYPRNGEALFMVEEGAMPEEVDEVLTNFGFPMGPLEQGDLSGLDIGWIGRKAAAEKAGEKIDPMRRYEQGVRYCGIRDMLCEQGRFGRKTGSGFYKYEKPGAKKPYPDPYVKELIETYCKDRGIVRRQVTPREIEERCIYSLINEGFKVLEEGIVEKPEDIDTVWLLGYAWPRHTGGPMFYANTIGVKKIYERLCYYYEQHPSSPHFQPSELLRKVAHYNTPMAGWTKMRASKL